MGPLIPLFSTFLTSALGFIARVDPSLGCFVQKRLVTLCARVALKFKICTCLHVSSLKFKIVCTTVAIL